MSYVTSLLPSVFFCCAFRKERIPSIYADQEQYVKMALAAAALLNMVVAGLNLIPVFKRQTL